MKNYPKLFENIPAGSVLKIKVVKDNHNEPLLVPCSSCVFRDFWMCDHVACMFSERPDGISVSFVIESLKTTFKKNAEQ